MASEDRVLIAAIFILLLVAVALGLLWTLT